MSKVLKIAVDARPLTVPNTGMGRYLFSILREFALAQTPHQFLLYCDRPFELRFPLPEHWTVRTGGISSLGRSTAFAQVFFPIWALRDGIDVFWSPRHQLPLLLPPRCRKVLTVHDVVWKRFPQSIPRGLLALEALLMPLSLRIADQAVTDSWFSRSEILHYFPWANDKVAVVYLASILKAEEKVGACPLRVPYFLTVGSYEPRKNFERMLRAYLQYRQINRQPWDLAIVGTGQQATFTAVSEFVAENQLQSCVHLLGGIDDSILRSLYAHARAVVMISLYEGFGLPLVEAMQWDLPLIASNTSSVAEIAGPAGLLVDPMDTEAIADGFTRITQDEGLRAELAQKSQECGRQFSWQRAASETMALLSGEGLSGTPESELHQTFSSR